MEFPSGFIVELWKKAGFEVWRSGSSWVSPDCPRCGRASTGHRVSLDPEKNVWKCFGEGCGAQGGVKDFCKEMGWDFQEILRSNGGREWKSAEVQKNKKIVGDLSSILTEDLSASAKEYLRSRGIDPELVKDYVFGIKPSAGKYALWLWTEGYHLFVPQYSPDGEILSGRFRLVKGEGVKSRSPKGRSSYLFRELVDLSDVQKGFAVVVEGEMDFLSGIVLNHAEPELFAQCIFYAVPGATYTFREEDIKSIPDEVVLFLDRGAEKEAERLARQLYAAGKKIYIGKYPEPFKDLNEWLCDKGPKETARGLVRAIEKAWVEGVYTPLGIMREVKDFVAKLEGAVEAQERLGEIEFLRRAKVYSTGISALDEILCGGFYPALYGIAGAPGAGKTSFILALIKRIIEQNNAYVLFASLEMPIWQIIAYYLSWGAQMSWIKILKQELDRTDLEKIKQAAEDLSWLFNSISVLSAPLGVEDIERELVELKNMAFDEGRPFFVVVDYLQMLKLKGPDIRLGITDAVRRLAELANKYEVPVLVVSSVARGVVEEALKGKKSLKEVFKESGDIEYAIFAGFLLIKEEERDGGERINRLVLVKNRGGAEMRKGKPIEIAFSFNIYTGEVLL